MLALSSALLLVTACGLDAANDGGADAYGDGGHALDADVDADGGGDVDADLDGDIDSCSCARLPGRCDASVVGSTSPCPCDNDCDAATPPCDLDGYCDDWCPEGTDIDCSDCWCDYYSDVCEAADFGSTDNCLCDRDCTGAHSACERDGHCDTWCPEGADPNCGPCECDGFDDVCEPSDDGTLAVCTCDPDCSDGGVACRADGHCDTWCDPGGLCQDPDCTGAGGSGYHTGDCRRT